MEGLDEAIQKIRGLGLRYWLLQGHYRQPVNYTEDAVAAATSRIMKIYGFIARHPEYITGEYDAALLEEVISPLKDDLNSPQVLANLAVLQKDITKNPTAEKMGSFVKALDMLGLAMPLDLPEEVDGYTKHTEGGVTIPV